jgi:hypothetical protein
MKKLSISSVDDLVHLCWLLCCRWVVWGIVIELCFGLLSLAIHRYGPNNLSDLTIFLIILSYYFLDVLAWCGAFYLSFRAVAYHAVAKSAQ